MEGRQWKKGNGKKEMKGRSYIYRKQGNVRKGIKRIMEGIEGLEGRKEGI
jgi:hypothetical protein